MNYLLDSNACIVFLNKRSDKLKQRLEHCQPEQILLCSVVKAELFYGAMKSQNPAASLAKAEHFCAHFQSLPFDDKAALVYGKIRSDKRNGTAHRRKLFYDCGYCLSQSSHFNYAQHA